MDCLESMCKISLEEELERNPDLDRNMIQSIQEWAKKQPHLPPILDNQIVIFLVVSNSSIEKAKKLIDVHFTMKTHFKDLFHNRDPLSKSIQDTMEVMNMTTLKGLDYKGRRVNYTSLKTSDATKYNAPSTVKLIYMFEDLNNFYKGSHKKGITVIMDATGFGVSHMSTISLSFLKQSMNYFTQGANVMVNEIIIINANSVAEKVVMLLKPFAPPEIFKRIHILSQGKMDKIYDFLSKDIVPSDIGGDGPSIEELTRETYQTISDNREFFIQEEKLQRVNENLRPANNENKKISQMSGSFKKLDLD